LFAEVESEKFMNFTEKKCQHEAKKQEIKELMRMDDKQCAFFEMML